MVVDCKHKLVSLVTPNGEKLEYIGNNPYRVILIICFANP